MPYRTTTPPELIAKRRAFVARAVARGISQRAVARAIEKVPRDQGLYNTVLDKPWSRTVIQNDIHALTKAWLEHARADTDKHKASVLAGLEEIYRVAWEDKNIKAALKALEQKAKLLGLNAPEGLQIGVEAPAGAHVADALSDEALLELAIADDKDMGPALKVIDVTPNPPNGTGGNGAAKKGDEESCSQ